MKHILLSLFIILSYFQLNAQNSGTLPAQSYSYEISILKNGSPGHVIKNQTVATADTTAALCFGTVMEQQAPALLVNIMMTDVDGQTFSTSTDMDGKFRIHIKPGLYRIKCVSQSNNQVIIEKLLLKQGQIQEIMVEMGLPSSFQTYEISSPKPLSAKELKQRETQLKNNK